MIIVSIGQGKLKGRETKTDNGIAYYEFLGVPYAKPPIGNLRFQNPQPPEPWDGERDATVINENNVCSQIDMIKGNLIGSEDCLYLNVYTPKLPDPNTDLLPVMVFIHGGGFIYGNGILKQELGPDYLIDNNVVVVTFNYRLGVLGFLSLDIPEVRGNMGLKDQVQALKWIQSNIDKFGGDPHNVMIFGVSAGSASIDYHLLSPLSKGLFHKAIQLSGSSLNHWAVNYEPKKVLESLLDKMGYDGSTQDDDAIYKYLITSPLSVLIEAAYKDIDNLTSNRVSFGFVPVIEKYFGDNEAMLTDIPYRLFKDGRFNRVPVIKGFCNKEGYMTYLTKPHVTLDVVQNKNFVDHWAYEMKESDKNRFNRKFSEIYWENIQPEDDSNEVGIDFFTDFDFIAGVKISGEMLAQKGAPVYFYEFTYDGKINFFKQNFGITHKGAIHADDMGYIFKYPFSKLADTKDKEVRANICKMWTNFAKTGTPTPDDIPIPWSNYAEDSPLYLRIGDQFTIKAGYEPKKMAVYREIYDKYMK
ncbi:unnamed protein product [Euphydryas editha]|uniref:Carboxylic ester hydrolase n=1 Tax=Euphydryas editha TaxID=104508 RepID=A0AAU9UQY7_EUPED|nr:unnamed protein product [Euphydryas editha]